MKAFPSEKNNILNNQGIDLRDYFAIRFAEVQLNLIKDEQFDALETFKTSYRLADMMIIAREQK